MIFNPMTAAPNSRFRKQFCRRYSKCAKRTQMTAAPRTEKHRFSEGIRIFRFQSSLRENHVFAKRTQIEKTRICINKLQMRYLCENSMTMIDDVRCKTNPNENRQLENQNWQGRRATPSRTLRVPKIRNASSSASPCPESPWARGGGRSCAGATGRADSPPTAGSCR